MQDYLFYIFSCRLGNEVPSLSGLYLYGSWKKIAILTSKLKLISKCDISTFSLTFPQGNTFQIRKLRFLIIILEASMLISFLFRLRYSIAIIFLIMEFKRMVLTASQESNTNTCTLLLKNCKSLLCFELFRRSKDEKSRRNWHNNSLFGIIEGVRWTIMSFEKSC